MLSQIVKIGADATGFHRVVAGVANVTNKAFAAVGKEITNRFLGAFAAGAVIDRITGFVKDTVDYADNLGDLAENLGITVEEVQRLQVASSLAGVKFGKLQVILEKIIALQADAVQGDKKAVGIFAALGLDPNKANALEIMQAAIGNQAVAADLFGKKINNVSNTIEKLRKLGPIKFISEGQSDELGKANDQIEEAYRKLKVSATPGIVAALKGGAAALDQMSKPGTGPIGSGIVFDTITNTFKRLFGGTEGGVDLSALPIDPNRKGKKQQNQPPATPPLSLALQSDALSRIGLFVGGRTSVADQMVTIGNYQLSELRAIRQSIQEANR